MRPSYPLHQALHCWSDVGIQQNRKVWYPVQLNHRAPHPPVGEPIRHWGENKDGLEEEEAENEEQGGGKHRRARKPAQRERMMMGQKPCGTEGSSKEAHIDCSLATAAHTDPKGNPPTADKMGVAEEEKGRPQRRVPA